MRVLSVNGSPRAKGNTHLMLQRVCGHLSKAGHEIDEVCLEEVGIAPCRACMVCAEVKDGQCHGHDDACNGLIERSRAADVILLGSPVYFGSVTGQIKAYMDRVGFVSRVTDQFLARKIGAAVVPARRAGLRPRGSGRRRYVWADPSTSRRTIRPSSPERTGNWDMEPRIVRTRR